MISPNDIFLGLLSRFFSSWFWIYIYYYWVQERTPSAMVGIIMLSESVLGPVGLFYL